MNKNIGYTLLLWNKKYGSGAKFVVKDNKTDKFAEFSPANPKDIAWVSQDISKESDYKDWEDFQNERVEDINSIVM
jgi:hypothetical protein